MEEFAENAELLAELREYLWDNAVLHSQLIEGKAEEGAKFRDYFDYREALRQVPSHRALALFRGRNEGVLQMTLEIGDPEAPGPDPGERRVAVRFGAAISIGKDAALGKHCRRVFGQQDDAGSGGVVFASGGVVPDQAAQSDAGQQVVIG